MLPRSTLLAGATTVALLLIATPGRAQKPAMVSTSLIDKRAVLAKATWLDNRDYDWFVANAPFIDTPDKVIDDTFLYRVELMTKHFVYGSPEHGYSVTEFIDRPGWSGTYGAISAPLGLQFADLRWLRDQRVARDYARYWMNVPGAQPRSYSNWFGSAMWGLYQAWGDRRFIVSMLPDMKAQFAGFEEDHWDKRYKMFVWDGMHDGMETNINSRQTKDWFAGAPGVRPTLSSYMYGDARAIARTARLAGDLATAAAFEEKATSLKRGVQDMLWDEKRNFFFHMFANDEKPSDDLPKDVKPGSIKAGTLTYQTGPFAGNEHGRELIGYVPWQFGLPDPGFEIAWAGIKNVDVFQAAYGPTVTERHDPLFRITPRCCVWSGDSWPFATAQTLEAMANLLNDYRQEVIKPADYYRQLRTFSATQRLDGVPYIAEAANPDTGRWQIVPGHSEHYFHSSYVDLVVTGLAGLRPRDDDRLVVNPLLPSDWNWFALEDVPYHGHLVSIVWDRDGRHYGRGKGLSLLADGKVIANAAELGRLEATLATGPMRVAERSALPVNFAVNNSGTFFPRLTASYGNPRTPIQNLNDGAYWYLKQPGNRWTTEGAKTDTSTLELDFGITRPVDSLKLYFIDDGVGSAVEAPSKLTVDYWSEKSGWHSAPVDQGILPLTGHRPTILKFGKAVAARKFRITVTARHGSATGLTEVEAWGNATLPLTRPDAPIEDLAFNGRGIGFPKASASYTSPFDRIEEINDGKVLFSSSSRNRWTAFKSPAKRDWVAIDFGVRKNVGRIEIYYWGDGGEVSAPATVKPQYWTGRAWRDFVVSSSYPEKPISPAMQTIFVKPVVTRRLRVLIDHAGRSRAGITELMAWRK